MAQIPREASTACRDIQFQRFPNQARDDPTNLVPQDARGDGVTWIRKGTLGSIGGAGAPTLLSRPCWSLAPDLHAPSGHHGPKWLLPE